MQLILNDQVRRQQARHRQVVALSGVAWAIEAIFVAAFDASEESAHMPCPGERCELVHGRDEEAWKPPIDRLVNRKNWQRHSPPETAFAIDARNSQVLRTMVIRNQSERCRFELHSAPWTLFKRNRGRLPVIVSKPDG